MKKILILSYTKLDTDPRPNRQIRWLKDDFAVYSAGTQQSGEEIDFFELKKPPVLWQLFRLILLKLCLYELYYWDRYKREFAGKLKKGCFDLIIVHEIRLVPLALRIKKGAKIILDAHEYSPENFNDQFLWRFFIKKYYQYLCEKFIKRCDAIVTVSEGIAKEYSKNFLMPVEVITGASDFVELEPSQVSDGSIKMIHHGNAGPSRKLEIMIEMMDYLDQKYLLDLMLVSSWASKHYLNKLQKLAKQKKNIRFLDPVPYNDLIKATNKYDFGISLFPPTNFNLRYALPNKFFQYIQARLAIATGPSIEIEKYVNKYDVGVVAQDFSPQSMARAIESTSVEKIIYYKEQSHKFAKELSAEKNMPKFKEIVSRLIE